MPDTVNESAERWATKYNDAANAIADFLDENFDALSNEDAAELSKSEKALRRLSKKMRDEAIVVAMEGLSEDLKAITKATERGTKAILKINDVKKGIRIVTGVIQLGTAVVTGNPVAAIQAAKGLSAELKTGV
ncbi:MAG: hypothetical protein NTW74_02840 [Acidobacteria bacterium]|nr:hypothetical protein [Acidobacteriota bacterium]